MTEHGEMGPEARNTLQHLMLLPQKNNVQQKLSLKKKRETESIMLLKAQGIKFGEKCSRCEVNCKVKHEESMVFWARLEGIEPEYCMEQRDEAVQNEMKSQHISELDAKKIVDSEVEYLMETEQMTKEGALLALTGLKQCPKQGRIEKSKIKKKRRSK